MAFTPPKTTKSGAHAPTPAQLGMLLMIARDKGSTVTEMSQHLCMTPSAATQLIDSLVSHRLLKRTTDTKDRRKIHLTLTESGKKMLLRARKQRLKALADVLSPLTDTELKQLVKLQQKLASRNS
ncbi:MAG TPA: MarR family transcriptional regulator [Candidatus Peribacteraceae bacterium]|nr:MarR family transcriptional regulator [Candidatus Peribacteraceae bacterium]